MHDWANPENTIRSWDMVARYVIPEINGYVDQAARVAEVPDRQPRRVRARRPGHHGQDHGERKAAAALPLTGPGRVAIPTINAPDLQKEAAKRKA